MIQDVAVNKHVNWEDEMSDVAKENSGKMITESHIAAKSNVFLIEDSASERVKSSASGPRKFVISNMESQTH